MAKEVVNLCGINTQRSHILVVSTNTNKKIQNVMNQNCISTCADGHPRDRSEILTPLLFNTFYSTVLVMKGRESKPLHPLVTQVTHRSSFSAPFRNHLLSFVPF